MHAPAACVTTRARESVRYNRLRLVSVESHRGLSSVHICVQRMCSPLKRLCFCFFFNDTATTEIYPLSLHDALPISVPPFPVLSVLLARFESDSAGVAVAVLSNAPAALIVAVTLIVVFAPEASEGIVHGRAAQPLPLTFVMVRFVGVSVTWMLVAVDRPAFVTTNV